jgi:hypothetical protein
VDFEFAVMVSSPVHYTRVWRSIIVPSSVLHSIIAIPLTFGSSLLDYDQKREEETTPPNLVP